MYIESIVFKREKNSKWEEGYYVGETDNCKKSVILDKNYNPLPKDEEGLSAYDYHSNTENWIKLRVPENTNS